MKRKIVLAGAVLALAVALAALGLSRDKTPATVYFMTEQGLAVTEDGSGFYQVIAPGGPQSPCLVVDGQAYFGGAGSQGLYTLSAEGRPVLLSQRLGWMPGAHIMQAAEGYVFFGGYEAADTRQRQGYVYRLNRADNTVARIAPVDQGCVSYGVAEGTLHTIHEGKLHTYTLDGVLLATEETPERAYDYVDGALWRLGAQVAEVFVPSPDGGWDSRQYTAETLGVEGFWPREVKDGYLIFFTEGTDIGWVSGSLGLLSLADGSVRLYGDFPREPVWRAMTERSLYVADGAEVYRIDLHTGEVTQLVERPATQLPG